jgi:CDP-glucose 4,6-dehydratase
LEPLAGYLLLGSKMLGADPARVCEAWNFGPSPQAHRTVREVVEALIAAWGEGRWSDASEPGAVHEAKVLRLSIEKAAGRLDWRPVLDFSETMRRTAEGYRRLAETDADPERVRQLMLQEIGAFTDDAARRGLGWAAP